MNDHQEHISHYSAADIQRYVQGKLSAKEMHAMEKAALDDPFLADAMEGMQQAFTNHNESLITGELQQLQQQFQTRTATTGKVVAFKPFRYWQAAAAAAVVVIVTGVWLYSLTSDSAAEKNSAPVIAKTDEVVPQQQPATAWTDSIQTTNDTDSKKALDYTITANSEKGTYKDKAAKPDQSVPAPTIPVPNATASQQFKTDSLSKGLRGMRTVVKEETKEVLAERSAAAPTSIPEPAKAKREQYTDLAQRETEVITIPKNDSKLKKSYALNNLSGVIKGRVTDQNNNPIANAYIQIPKNNKDNIITDKTGFFKIPASDSIVDVAINVRGYGTQNFRLQNNAVVNQLQLQPANVPLDAVAIPGSNDETKQAYGNSNKLPNTIVHEAQPVIGWDAFDEYLEKNKNAFQGNMPSGNVVVSFEVNKKGALSQFKIEQSLSKAYDDEAIRLIQQGPAWKLLKGRKARITLMVRF